MIHSVLGIYSYNLIGRARVDEALLARLLVNFFRSDHTIVLKSLFIVESLSLVKCVFKPLNFNQCFLGTEYMVDVHQAANANKNTSENYLPGSERREYGLFPAF